MASNDQRKRETEVKKSSIKETKKRANALVNSLKTRIESVVLNSIYL